MEIARTSTWECAYCDRTVEVPYEKTDSAPYPRPPEDGWAELNVRVYADQKFDHSFFAKLCPDHVPAEA